MLTVIALPLFIAVVTYKGYKPLLPAAVGVTILALILGMSLSEGLEVRYIEGLIVIFQKMFLLWCGISLFAKVMDDSGYAESLAYFLAKFPICEKFPIASIYVISAILSASGLSFGVIAVMFPIALVILKKANYTTSVMGGAILGGSFAISACVPYIPNVANAILPGLLGLETVNNAGLLPGLVGGVFLAVSSIIYLEWRARKWQKEGRGFDQEEDLPKGEPSELPSPAIAAIPMILCIILYNVVNMSVGISLIISSVLVIVLRIRTHTVAEWMQIMQDGIYDGVMPAINIACVGGIASIISETPFYAWFIQKLSSMSMSPYILIYAATCILAGLFGSGSSSMVTVSGIFGEAMQNWVTQGYSMGNFARLIAMGQITFDSLPHNGGVIVGLSTLKLPMQKGYKCVFMTCAFLPLIAGILGVTALLMFG